MSADCIVKAFCGCACPARECAEQPLTPAPVTFISWRKQAITCLTFGFLAAIITAAWMEAQFKNQDLADQELMSWK
ncbi:hypothetical protein Rleg4DRAFT_1485 [Rhizobium leguminosarum bv. trifolii WSM2297]|uniref:Transmembrane protein n=1 Tax=Rhizobium leguminosarum bv. trifolii WSM2297 TaxID=754762 RepID=J0W2D1_RHILT|nr:hypothetical protein [Rhizobium leguminosarum]EJC79881.1 hypothetical protein Rleg4DRAFT_1485 [Rhizobium leguminosarum bv. trifolii WSM2297]